MWQRNRNKYARVTDEQLLQWYDAAVAASVNIAVGGQGEAYAYSQGDGARSVTYTRTNGADLSRKIAELEKELVARGLLVDEGNKLAPIRPYF